MARACLLVAGLLAVLLIGCGGSEEGSPPTPPDAGGDPALQQVGPLLVRPASAASFVAQGIPNPNGEVSLVALYGSRITYLASQALLDRIVFGRADGPSDVDIWICDLDGSNARRLINNTHVDSAPEWSPDGRQIAFTRQPSGQDSEIAVMNADGSGVYALTSNSDADLEPTWSPNGDQIAFETDRTGNAEIFVMYPNGSGAVNLTVHANQDYAPHWCRRLDSSLIVFVSARDGNQEIYRMNSMGGSLTRLTNIADVTTMPAISPDGSRIAFAQSNSGNYDIWTSSAGGVGSPIPCAAGPYTELAPSWSSDGRFVCYTSSVDGDYELMLRETTAPYRRYQVTRNVANEQQPHLGSPTLQTDRVIIGPSGADWGGGNPVWSSSDAGIVAYGEEGYRNFVRIGIAAAHLPTLSITPLAGTASGIGSAPVGVVVEAADIVNLREDGGRDATPLLWQLDPLDATAVLLYFDSYTGKLLAALVLRDQNYPAGASAFPSAVSQRVDGGGVVAHGDFAAVFDATGARVADAAAEVRVAAGAVSVLR